jgi:hypothetical protein
MAIPDVVQKISEHILQTSGRTCDWSSKTFWNKFENDFSKRTKNMIELVKQELQKHNLTLNLDDKTFGKENKKERIIISYDGKVLPPQIQMPSISSCRANENDQKSPVNSDNYKIKTSHPNLFESLITFRSRKHHTPRENFLTESFAYLLRIDECVCNRWLSVLLNKNIERAMCKIATRQRERDEGRQIIPDMLIYAQFSKRESICLYFEHKWDSPCNEEQLKKYKNFVKKKGDGARLFFVGATREEQSKAVEYFQDKACACFLWEDVYRALNDIPNKSGILNEFLGFMDSQGLGPEQPITVESIKKALPQASYLKSLLKVANKLNDNYQPWDIIPKRFHTYNFVQKAYGRVGIRFETEDFKPGITIGFLYDGKNHEVALVNPEKGVDLMLRIEAYPRDTKDMEMFKHTLNVLKNKRKKLEENAASVLLKGEPGNGNAYSVLMVQDCLADVIGKEKDASDQLSEIYTRLNIWLEILFKDGKLEEGFQASGLDSGMIKR